MSKISLFPRLAAASALLAVAFAFTPAVFAQQPAAPPTPAAQPDAIGLDSKLDPKLAEKLLVRRAAPIRGVAISPDGSTVAWGSASKDGARIELTSLQATQAQKALSAGPADKKCSTVNPVWSPDSKWLAVLSDCGNTGKDGDQDQVFVINIADGSARQLGSIKGNVDDLGWSPDGKFVSFLYVANSTRPSGAVAAQRVPEGVIDLQMVTEVQRLATLDAVSGALHFVTPGNLHIYEYDWSADSGTVVYTAAPPPGENNWWVAKLYTQPAAGGQPNAILDPSTVSGPLHGLQIAVPPYLPRWLPDCIHWRPDV